MGDLDQILAIIRDNPSRAVDNFIISQDPAHIHTALVVGPLIYGRGRGPVNKRSMQAPDIARNTIAGGQGFQFGKGLSKWSNIHVSDIAGLIVRLAEAAMAKKDGMWNLSGIFLPENGAMVRNILFAMSLVLTRGMQSFGKLCELIAKEAHDQGLISSPTVEKTLTVEEANAATHRGAILWGTNAVIKSLRGQKLLGWTPSALSLEASIADIVKSEAESVGK